jgi:hypothetical protein
MKRAWRRLLPCLLALSACAAPARRPASRPVSPGQNFPGEALDIRAPNSHGWSLMSSNPGEVVFASDGAAPGESFIANVTAFAPPKEEGRERFLAYVKEGVAKDTPPPRFNILRSEIKPSTRRPYPCVSVEYAAEDTQAQTSRSKRETLLLEVVSLYCLHPVRKDLALAIVYSHRGRVKDPALAAAAADFIEGVQVPKR